MAGAGVGEAARPDDDEEGTLPASQARPDLARSLAAAALSRSSLIAFWIAAVLSRFACSSSSTRACCSSTRRWSEERRSCCSACALSYRARSFSTASTRLRVSSFLSFMRAMSSSISSGVFLTL